MDYCNPKFDDADQAILDKRLAVWATIPGPRVGDYVIFPDGKTNRFTHNWGDSLQTGGGGDSFYFGEGFISYSGGLDPSLPKANMIDTGETRPGSVWFFHHNHSRAHNGVYAKIDCRVFRYQPEQKANG